MFLEGHETACQKNGQVNALDSVHDKCYPQNFQKAISAISDQIDVGRFLFTRASCLGDLETSVGALGFSWYLARRILWIFFSEASIQT
jgi:hypothetical protein